MKLCLKTVTALSFLVQLTHAVSVPSRSAGGKNTSYIIASWKSKLNTSNQLSIIKFTVCGAVQRKIVCYGGYNSNGDITADTWSIDASSNFALSTPTWTNVTHNDNFVTTPAGYAIGVALNDGVSFLINGGLSNPTNTTETNQTTVLNTATNTWNTVNSSTSTQTRQHAAVIDATGKIWLWGGVR